MTRRAELISAHHQFLHSARASPVSGIHIHSVILALRLELEIAYQKSED